MSTYRVFSCVVGRGCLLWPSCVLLAEFFKPFPCFIVYSKAKFACYSRCFLTSYFCNPVPYNEKDIFFCVLVLEGLVDLHRTVQLQVLHHYWLGHKLRLPWYWKIFLGNEQRSFCHFWDCIQVSLTQGTWICALWKIVEDRGAMCFKSWNHEGLDMSWQLNKH